MASRLAPDLRSFLRRAAPTPLRRAAWSASEALQRQQQRVFERRLGASTSGHAYYEGESGLASADQAFYEGCDWLPLRRALKALDPGPSDVFVDFGSGKGQALLIAGLEPYGRIVGIELMDELTREAQRNIAAARPRLKAGTVEALTADALEWPIPDDLSLVFLYCPFMGDVFEGVMRRIYESYDRNPRPLHIVYAYPWEHDRLMTSGRVVLADVRPAQWPAWPWWWRTGWAMPTYRVVPAGEGGPGVPAVRRRLYRPRRALKRWSGPNDHRFKLVRDGEAVATSRP